MCARGGHPERAQIRIRRKQAEASDSTLELKAIDVILRVEQAYWDLVAARQDEQVEADSVAWAQEQLARNQRMIDAGNLAPVELAASKAELERRRDTWFTAIGRVTTAENGLKLLLAGSRSAPLWEEEVLPSEDQRRDAPIVEDLPRAVAGAIGRRPEVRLVELNREGNEIQKALSSAQVRPQVNLVAAYSNGGLGGSISTQVNPFSAANAASFQRLNDLSALAGLPALPPSSFGGAPDFLVGGYGTTLSNLFSGRYQSLQVGLAMDLTFRNRTAEANLAQTAIAGRRLKLERAQVEQVIEAQVRNALQALETARQRITASQSSVDAAKEKLDSEVRLFQTGESTNFLVLTRQNEYADSRRRRVVATLDFNRAAAVLEQALGSVLERHGVVLK